jgi:integrase
MLVRMLFDEARRQDMIESNPVERCIKVNVKRERRQILTLAQVGMVAAAANDAKVKLWVLLAGYCGLRESEVAGLKWQDWNGEA